MKITALLVLAGASLLTSGVSCCISDETAKKEHTKVKLDIDVYNDLTVSTSTIPFETESLPNPVDVDNYFFRNLVYKHVFKITHETHLIRLP